MATLLEKLGRARPHCVDRVAAQVVPAGGDTAMEAFVRKKLGLAYDLAIVSLLAALRDHPAALPAAIPRNLREPIQEGIRVEVARTFIDAIWPEVARQHALVLAELHARREG